MSRPKSIDEYVPSEEEVEEAMQAVQEDEVKALRTQLSVLDSQVRGLKEEVKPMLVGFEKELKRVNERLDACMGFFDEARARRGADEYGGVVQAINKGFKDLIDYKRGFERKMDERRAGREKPRERPSEPERGEPMSVSVDLSKITWMQRDRKVVSASAQWGWAFGFDRDGAVLPETKEVVELLERYGEIEVDGHIVKFSGDKGNLISKSKRR